MANKKTDKQQRLIACYAGDIKEAAEKAEISYGYACNLMTNSDILEAIRNRQDTEVRPITIAKARLLNLQLAKTHKPG